jgi:hypothetical protein
MPDLARISRASQVSDFKLRYPLRYAPPAVETTPGADTEGVIFDAGQDYQNSSSRTRCLRNSLGFVMADTPTPGLGHTAEELTDVLLARLGERAPVCVVCDQNQWFAAGPSFVDATGELGVVGVGGRLPVLLFACANCGYVRSHSVFVLHRQASRLRKS